MSSLPTWASWAIVAACPLLGVVIAFLMFLAVVVLDRWITEARKLQRSFPSRLEIGEYFRRRLTLRAPDPVAELVIPSRLSPARIVTADLILIPWPAEI